MRTYRLSPRVIGLLALMLAGAPAFAQTTIDFEEFAEGEIVSSIVADGITVGVSGLNPDCPDANAAATFDSDCTGADCTGQNPANNDDGDLGVFSGNVLIVHERCEDLDNGFVNENPGDNPAGPDDYGRGGINGFDFAFSAPITFFCLDVIDKEGNETDELELFTDSGSTTYTLPKPGNGLVATYCPATDSDTPGAGIEGVTEVLIRQTSSGAYDNFVFETPPDDCEDQCFETFLTSSDIDEEEEEYTYTFETCKVDDFCRGFSFVAIEIPDGAEVLSASRGYDTNSNGRYDPDYDFIKFEDIGGSGNVGQCESITFTLDTPYADLDNIDVRVKFGRTDASNRDKTEDILVGVFACTDDAARSGAPFFDPARSTTPSSAAISAYPNPMNSRTTFSVTLEEAAEVRLVIYDVLGREVGVVTEGSFLPGTMTVSYDASDLPNGTYFYRLDASGKVTTGQLQVVR